LVSHIDQLQTREIIDPQEQSPREVSAIPRDLTEARQIDPLRKTRRPLRESRRTSNNITQNSKIEGIDLSEMKRRKAADECLRCAWPSDRKGNHYVKDCRQRIKTAKGTAIFAKGNNYQRPVVSLEKKDLTDSSDSEGGGISSGSDSQE